MPHPRTQETSDWLAEHLPHTRPTTSGAIKSRDIGHPDEKILTLTCPCGAQHTTFAAKVPRELWV